MAVEAAVGVSVEVVVAEADDVLAARVVERIVTAEAVVVVEDAAWGRAQAA